MNNVLPCPDDLNTKIVYQGTDSIHLNYDDAEIVERYMQKYDQELVGNDLGQFHVDFSMGGAKSEIYGVDGIFLGKKAYIDILEPTD